MDQDTHVGRRVALFVVWGCALIVGDVAKGQEAAHSAERALERRVESVLATPGFQSGQWGILFVDRKNGQTIYERNPDRLFAPASVTKLFSTAAALVELGPNHRFQTPVVRRGEVDVKGTLRGDLILIAQGDLAMGGRTGPEGSMLFQDNDHTYAGGNLNGEVVPTDPLAGLEHIAREVKAAGIREITGDVVIDDRLFSPSASTGSGPRIVSPIVINDNVIDVFAQPAAKVGEPARVSFQPATQFVTMDAQVATVESGAAAILEVRSVGSRRFTVRGRLPLGHHRVVKIYEIDEPASFARALLIEALHRHGVQLACSPLDVNVTANLPTRSSVAGLPRVAEYTSPPFSEYLRVILKVSHNLHASTLPLLLAARHGGHTLEAGLKEEGILLKSLGVEPETISFGGGAGGARADLVTPRATVTLLRAMAARPDFAAYDTALPILGRDGTLAKAVGKDSAVRGHVHAKTGTFFVENGLDGKTILTSKALAGYLETASGRSLVFAAFVNNVPLDAPRPDFPVSEATTVAGQVLGKLCEAIYSDSAPVSPPSTQGGTPPGTGSGPL